MKAYIKNSKLVLALLFFTLSSESLLDIKASENKFNQKQDSNQKDKEKIDLKNKVDYNIEHDILNKLRNAESLELGKLPKGISGVSILTFIPDCLKDRLSKQVLQDIIEFELRKIGVKIQDKSQCTLIFEINAFEVDDGSRYILTERLKLMTRSYFSLDGDKYYLAETPIWSNFIYGELGKNKANQSRFSSNLSEMMVSFCNRVLESREK